MTLKKGQILHAATKTVTTAEIVLTGNILMKEGTDVAILPPGSIVGLIEEPQLTYRFTYEAGEDCTLYAYPYDNLEDISKIIRVNQKIMPMLTEQTIRNALNSSNRYKKV